MLAGIDPLQHQAAGLQALFASMLQRDFRIWAEGQQVVLAVGLSKLETPDARTAWRHLDIQAVAIKQFVQLLAWLGVLDTSVSQRSNDLGHDAPPRQRVERTL